MRKVIAADDTHLHDNDASRTFLFEKLKDIVVDESNLCFISDRQKSITNGITKVYNHAHHAYGMRHLSENLWVNHHCGDSLYLYYNEAKAYSLEEFNDYSVEFKDKSLEALKERHAYVLKSKGNKMVPAAERIARKKMIEGYSLYVENITVDGNQFTVFSAGSTSTVNLLEKLCSCREYDLVKIPCTHAMTALSSKHDDEYGMNIYEYSSPINKATTYLLAYSKSINVVPIESE
ncbi:hypothetical protein RDI58_024704 [Solanum bulbocastanum]|uniref:SWIM-type domain-containing protein n=1 Tax=Solanum bulbocastanum TaxID=147425 RepID=A0AAN8Y3W6_SOLBU